MKKIYTILAAFAVVLSANAQGRLVSGSISMSNEGVPSFSAERTVTDTIYTPSVLNTGATGPTIYTSGNGGYVCGNNGYDDFAKVQAFTNSIGSIAVEGAIIWFGAKERDASPTSSKIMVREYSLNAAGTSSAGAVTNAPGTVNASLDVLYTDIDTGTSFAVGAMPYMFTVPVATSGDFGIGVDFTALGNGDTVGIVSSTDGDALGSDMSWEKWSDNSWHTMFQAWPLDIDFYIFALVDNNPSGIEEGYLNGVNLFQNTPNPAVNNTVISYNLENNTNNVSLFIFDVTGKMVKTFNEGNKPAGKYSINVSTADLTAGVYYYAITAGKGRIAKKMTVTK